MARYWVYVNDEVKGPFGVEQLIRMRGFSRQSMVCVEDSSGNPQNWISPAEIPELAHIFKAIDEQRTETPSTPKPVPRRAPAAPRAYTPAVTLKRVKPTVHPAWWIVACLLIALAGGGWFFHSQKGSVSKEHRSVQALIENLQLPATSRYSSISHYLQEKNVSPKWAYEDKGDGIYQASVSWYSATSEKAIPALVLYAFEVNLPVQTVRATNSAAAKLLSDGFPKPAATPTPGKESGARPTATFDASLNAHVQSVETGDFNAVWSQFSKRKRSEMAKGGISKDGFLRLQALTHRLESNAKLSVEKSKAEGSDERLVLLKQTQPGRADVWIKQLWIKEEDGWKLDDEQKKSADASTESTPVPSPTPATTAMPGDPASAASAPAENPTPKVRPSPATLPGMSN